MVKATPERHKQRETQNLPLKKNVITRDGYNLNNNPAMFQKNEILE